VLGSATAAQAQERPALIVEAVVADAAFIDEVWDHFFLIGGGARGYVTSRLAVGGEVAYMRGEAEAANTTILGTLTFDLRPPDSGRLMPYVIVAGGAVRQRTLVGTGPGGPPVLVPFISWEGTVAGGVGARIRLGSRVFVAPEFQFGWAPTARLAVKIGVH
jgi:hypothetical protein